MSLNKSTSFKTTETGLVVLFFCQEAPTSPMATSHTSKKRQHYVKENLLVKSLCPLAYENNPNFLKL
jgi:hypothetical protein